jgi:hypothetical protein
MSANITKDLLFRVKTKPLTELGPDQIFKPKTDILLTVMVKKTLLITPEVAALINKFIVQSAKEPDIEENITELCRIHDALDKQCRKELGIKALERELYKLD